MSERITVLRPVFTTALLSPNPGRINQAVVLTVTVVEQTVVLEAEARYAGEFYGGET